MTPEIIYDTYEYKIVKKVLKKKYPWIIDLNVNKNDLLRFSTIYVAVIINPYILQQETGWEFIRGADLWLQDQSTYGGLSSMYQITSEEGVRMRHEIQNTMNAIHKSGALPDELKVPSRYRHGWAIEDFIFPSHKKVPPPK
jgi:hypothetical protein